MELTKIQDKTLKFIKSFQIKKGRCPTCTEVAKKFGISSGASWDRIQRLKNKKLIKK